MPSIGSLVDCGIVLFLILQTFLGWRRGLLWQVAGVASIAFGIGAGILLAPWIGEHLHERVTSNSFHARLAAFLFIVALVGFILRIAAACAEVHAEKGLKKDERDRRRAADRILGGIFGAVKGSVLALLIVAASVACFPNNIVWRSSMLAGPLAVAGSRLLPEGACEEVSQWARGSAVSLRKLDFK
jgi:uncharacterized membrane protein required for colicin V production